MSLTRDGQRLLAKAEQTLAAHQGLMDEAMRIKGRLTGKLRLGAASNSNNEAIGRLLTILSERCPEVEVVWSGQSSVARPSLLWFSLQGSWSATQSDCYATILVDNVPLAVPCGTSQGQCWGAAYVNTRTSGGSLGYTGFASVAAGTHTLTAAVVPALLSNCTLIGTRIFYSITPQ